MEDRQLRLSSTTWLRPLARGLSLAGNPLFLVPVTVAATTRNWMWTAAVALLTTLPLVLLIRRNVRRGTWSDFDVSRHDQRLGLYAAGVPLLVLLGIVFYALGASAVVLRSVAAAAVIFASGVAGHRFLKLSLHMMLSAFCAVLFLRTYPAAAVPVILFVVLIAWSRRFLDRHTMLEIVVGTLIGTAAGVFAMW